MPFDDDRFDAFEEHGELSGTDEGDRVAFAGESHGNAEATGFETLVPQDITVAFPVEDFEPVEMLVFSIQHNSQKHFFACPLFNDLLIEYDSQW